MSGNDWKENIEAQLAICQDDELAWSIVQALLDVAVAADETNSVALAAALDKLREVSDE